MQLFLALLERTPPCLSLARTARARSRVPPSPSKKPVVARSTVSTQIINTTRHARNAQGGRAHKTRIASALCRRRRAGGGGAPQAQAVSINSEAWQCLYAPHHEPHFKSVILPLVISQVDRQAAQHSECAVHLGDARDRPHLKQRVTLLHCELCGGGKARSTDA